MARLLDRSFRYVPAVATNIASTWSRFGFSAKANAERRARQLALEPGPGDSRANAQALVDLVRRVTAAGTIL